MNLKPKAKRGEVGIAFILIAAVAALIVACSLKRDGTQLYPQSSYPYEGPIMVQTNQAPQPAW
jgi:hypothetical protein